MTATEQDPYFGGLTLDQIHRGQTRIAYRLAASHAGRIMFVYGIGWHYYDGARWMEDQQGMANRALRQVLTDSWHEAIADKELAADVRKCESAPAQAGVLQIASTLVEFAFTVKHLDADPYLLNVANGTLDLRTMELRDHDPADRITKMTTAAYDPEAIGRGWQKFLARVLPDEDVRGFLQRYVGVALCGKVLEHKLAILTGVGRNGKTTFYAAVSSVLGDYAHEADPDLFMHRENAHPVGEFDLRGRRWVVVSESDQGRKLAEATMKRLTGGDKINARRLYGQPVTFEPSHTPAMVTNHLPKVRGDDPAIWARLRVVPFDVVIPEAERDVRLTDKLEAEADAVLTWAIIGWRHYQTSGLAEPAAVMAATDAYHLDSDPVARFVEDRCILNPNMQTTVAVLWEAWAAWRTDDGAPEMNKREFGEALDRLGCPSVKGAKGVRIRRGLGLESE